MGTDVFAQEYDKCIDVDGNGSGVIQGTGKSCQIPPRFDNANVVNMRHNLNAFTDITFTTEEPRCDSMVNYMTLRGCITTIQSEDPAFIEFSVKNDIGFYGARSKFFSAGNNNNRFDKVMVIVGPHNTTGLRTIDQEISWMLNESRGSQFISLLSYLHEEGFSILYVSFTHPSSNILPIEDKSEALAKLLKNFNQIRKNNKTPSQEPLNLIGLSLGGVTSKFALAKMEQRGEEHNVGIYVSVDSPHNGAHVPVSIQQVALFLRDSFRYAERKTNVSGLFHFLVSYSEKIHLIFNDTIRSGLNELESGANKAAQAYYTRIGSISNSEIIAFNINYPENEFKSPQHEKFLKRSAELKMPQKTKINIAVTNGSLVGVGNDLPKDYVSLQTSERSGTKISFKASVDLANSTTFSGSLSFPNRNAIFLSDRSFNQTLSTFGTGSYKSRDLVPCSTSEEVVNELVSEVDAALEGFWSEKMTVYNNETCFVPVGSSLNSTLPRPFIHPDSHSVRSSQFDKVIGQNQNSAHMSFSREITSELISEIKKNRPLKPEVEPLLIEGDVYYVNGRNLTYRFNKSCGHLNSDAEVLPKNRFGTQDVRYRVLENELALAYSAGRVGNCLLYENVRLLNGTVYYIGGRNITYSPLNSCIHETNSYSVRPENNLDLIGNQDPRHSALSGELSGAYRANRPFCN